MIIWLIGMSGAGKTTLGQKLHDRLEPENRSLVYLDGDTFRKIFSDEVGHTIEGRRKNAERISHFCQFLDDQKIHAIAAVLSIFPEWQEWNRENFSEYFEIFLDIPLPTLKARDSKGLYSGGAEGTIKDVVGIDIPFPRPQHPDLVIDEALQDQGPDICVQRILDQLPEFD
jgi:adenylylsulfate kinase